MTQTLLFALRDTGLRGELYGGMESKRQPQPSPNPRFLRIRISRSFSAE